MITLQKSLLIADLHGRMSQNCSPGPDVFGEIWLRLQEGLVIVYWETWEVPREKDADCGKSDEPRCGPRVVDRGRWSALVCSWVSSKSRGNARWQAICVLKAEELPPNLKDLAAAFADPTKYDALLEAALKSVNDQIYDPLGRGRFLKRGHRWRQSSYHLFE